MREESGPLIESNLTLTPFEADQIISMFRYSIGPPDIQAAINAAINMGLFDGWVGALPSLDLLNQLDNEFLEQQKQEPYNRQWGPMSPYPSYPVAPVRPRPRTTPLPPFPPLPPDLFPFLPYPYGPFGTGEFDPFGTVGADGVDIGPVCIGGGGCYYPGGWFGPPINS